MSDKETLLSHGEWGCDLVVSLVHFVPQGWIAHPNIVSKKNIIFKAIWSPSLVVWTAFLNRYQGSLGWHQEFQTQPKRVDIWLILGLEDIISYLLWTFLEFESCYIYIWERRNQINKNNKEVLTLWSCSRPNIVDLIVLPELNEAKSVTPIVLVFAS